MCFCTVSMDYVWRYMKDCRMQTYHPEGSIKRILFWILDLNKMLKALLFQAAIQPLNAQGPQKHRPFPRLPTEPRWPPCSGRALFPERAEAFQPCETRQFAVTHLLHLLFCRAGAKCCDPETSRRLTDWQIVIIFREVHIVYLFSGPGSKPVGINWKIPFWPQFTYIAFSFLQQG